MPWLPEAIESLFHQTADNFEILAIVDGGSDGSAEYLRSLRNPRLRVLEQENRGVTATLNRLLSEARTPWLVRMDADDISYPTRIEKLQAAILDRPDSGAIYSLADYHPRERCAGQFRCSRGTTEQLRAIVERGYLLSICHSTVAVNVEKTLAVGGYRMELHAEDADLWWRMARRYEIHFIPEALVGFRLSAESVSSRHLEKQQLAAIYVQYLLLSDLWGLTPRPLTEIREPLLGFLRPRAIAAKQSLRRFNIELAQGRRMRGMGALARAVCASPAYVLRRAADEMRHTAISNGVSPHLFLKRKDELWT
jgi:cellulose synthase/poly-beta-1,6-N-acetylglucosamine synthase-like glycosyltransferase